MSQVDFLQKELQGCISDFKVQSTKHKNQFRMLRYAVYMLTALSTALAAISLADPGTREVTGIGIVVATAMISIASAIEGLRKPGELWIHERTLYRDLLALQRDVGFAAASGDMPPDEVSEFHSRLQMTLASGTARWKQHVSADDGKQAIVRVGAHGGATSGSP